MNITWHCKHFSELTADEFHDLLQTRINVFVVEQNCPYPELDGKDKDAFHVFGMNKNHEAIAVCRILSPGVSYDECSIGRVVTSKDARLTGAGIELMKFAHQKIKDLFGDTAIRISAQEYLRNFYEKFGYVKVSNSYLEDNIPHIEMLREPQR